MKPSEIIAYAGIAAGLIVAMTAVIGFAMTSAQAADDPPLMLARDGFFYVNAKTTTVDGKDYVSHQMYVEVRIPAKQTHPYPIVMVHGGTMSGTNYTGTPDGREGWAQYFVRQGYAVYVVDQPGRARSGYLAAAYGPMHNVERGNALSRFVAQEKFKLWPQAVLHTQWPGSGEPDDPATVQLAASQMPAIADFASQQFLNRDALLALLDKIGPAILLTHSQAGAFGWPVADARPDLVKAILAIEPNGPPFYQSNSKARPIGSSKARGTALWHHRGAADLCAADQGRVRAQDGAAGQGRLPDLVRCYAQAEPARQLPNLQKMPILVLTAEASYHAPYDHCTVNICARPASSRLTSGSPIGIKGNSHVMMLEKNNKEIAAVIAKWLDEALQE